MAHTARFLLYALLIWAPLPLASNRAIVWVLNGGLAALVLCLFLIGEFGSKTERDVNWRPAALALAGITLWSAWMVFQALPVTPSAFHHPIWSGPGADLAGAHGAISINPASTWATIAEFVPIVLLGLVSFRIAQDASRARTLLHVVVAATVLVAVLGLASFLVGFDLVSLLDTPHYHGYLTATFVGRAAVASYFAVGMVAAAALVVSRFEESRGGDGHRLKLSGSASAALADSATWIVAVLILLLALLETGSRGGAIAAGIGMLVVVAVSLPSARFGLAARTGAILLALVAFGALVWAIGGRLFERLGEGIGDQDRLMVYRETIDMILARPLLGQGAGTFADAYPMFQGPGDHNLIWLRAHSTFLQAAAELGLPAFALTLATILFVLVVIARALTRRISPSPAAITALAAAAGIAVQSAIDFSVQIQAVALTIVVLLGAGLGEAVRRPVRIAARSREPARPTANPGPPPRFERVSVTIPTARNTPSVLPAIGTLPEETCIYVFGDVHGRFDLLKRLRDAILRDRARSAPTAAIQAIGLGDFIDRGADSRRIVESLMSDFFECSATYIRGNHEQMLLDFLNDPATGPIWLRNGGRETLRSYSVDAADFTSETRIDYPRLRTAFRERLPDDHVAFLASLPFSLVVGGYFFVHAGARPGLPLHLQKPSDLLWIREGFADRDEEFERIVVHGHTPVDQPYFGKYRINLDTGAYLTNRLSCLVLRSNERRILEI